MSASGTNQPPNFDKLARLYRWMEWLTFGPYLALTRESFLSKLANSQRALILGDGDGRFTARLLRENPHIQIDAVDASTAMLHALLNRAGPNASRVRVYLGDVRNWQPPAPLPDPNVGQRYDLIATHFLLDCLSRADVEVLAARLRNVVTPSALWVVSEFAIPPGRFGRFIARPVVSSLYLAFGWLTGLATRALPDHASALGEAGFTLKEARFRLGGLLTGELWTARGTDCEGGFREPRDLPR